MTIKEWLLKAKKQYQDAREFSGLDLELILCRVLGAEDRSYLVLHENDELKEGQIGLADDYLRRRFVDDEPLAYIFSEKEFYGRKFYVDSRVLIPRPETEQLIEATRNIIKITGEGFTALDVGTGSGAVAVTLKKEFPKMKVVASDLSEDALMVARRNASNLEAKITFVQSDLLKEISVIPELVVANLPYVDQTWDFISENLRFEPRQALFAEDGGLLVIKRLITELAQRFSVNDKKENIYLILELDPSQKTDALNYAKGISGKYNTIFAEQKFEDDFPYVLCFKATRRK